VEPYTQESRSSLGAPIYKTIAEAFKQEKPALAIEFTRPDTAVANIKALAEQRIPVVVGTTGWLNQLEDLTYAVETAGSALLWAANFSLGVNLFYRIARFAAQLMDHFPEYDVGGWEAHHNKKVDSPSGTAKTLVEQVLGEIQRKKKPVWETLERPPAPDELHYPSLRVGSLPGIHTLIFDSPADTIEITHTARNREGLASGALLAAEWLLARENRCGVFTMDDVLRDMFGG
jgi:4-hydroxy-tetrahydrodipicolinate reductase